MNDNTHPVHFRELESSGVIFPTGEGGGAIYHVNADYALKVTGSFVTRIFVIDGLVCFDGPAGPGFPRIPLTQSFEVELYVRSNAYQGVPWD